MSLATLTLAPTLASAPAPVLAFFDSASHWWKALDAIGQIYAGIGLVAGAVTLVLLVFTILGLDQGGVSDALELDISADVDVHADGSFFSTRAIAGFFLGFGGGASIAYEATGNPYLSGAIGFAIGLVTFYGIYILGKKLLQLQSDGTVDYAQAVGSVGAVYITIPPKRSTGGQAQIVFNNRHEIIQAVSDGDDALPSGTNVRVKQQLAGNLFLVEPV